MNCAYPAVKDNVGGVRVVSLNAWCGGMLETLADWLPGCGADVLCVQEVTWTPGYDGWVTYADADRTSWQRSSLFEDLRRALPDHQAHFFTCDTGPVRGEDGIVRRQHFGIATLIAPHLAIIGGEASFVHGAFAHHDAWPSENRGRVAHAVKVADTDGRSARRPMSKPCDTPTTYSSPTAKPSGHSRYSPRPRCPTTGPLCWTCGSRASAANGLEPVWHVDSQGTDGRLAVRAAGEALAGARGLKIHCDHADKHAIIHPRLRDESIIAAAASVTPLDEHRIARPSKAARMPVPVK
jgi:hypothetical protein